MTQENPHAVTDALFSEAVYIKVFNNDTFLERLSKGEYDSLKDWQLKVLKNPEDRRVPHKMFSGMGLLSPCGWTEIMEDRMVKFETTPIVFDASICPDELYGACFESIFGNSIEKVEPPLIKGQYTEDEVRVVNAENTQMLQKQYETTDDEWLKQCMEAVLMPEVYEERKKQGRLVNGEGLPPEFAKLDISLCPDEFYNEP